MVDRCLTGSPLSMSVRTRGVSGKNLCQIPVEEIWIIDERLRMKCMIVKHYGSGRAQASAKTAQHKVHYPGICQPASHVEVLYWELSNEQKTQKTSQLSTRCVISPVKVGTVNRPSNDSVHFSTREPTSQLNVKINRILTIARSFSALGVHCIFHSSES